MSQIMLYKLGSMITCGPHSLDYIIADEGDAEEHLSNGWYAHPQDVPGEPLIGDRGVGTGSQVDMGEVSDGYHTFNELYAHRVRLFSSLMHAYPGLAWWSRKHSDGEEWEGWVIAGISTPEGEITYHLPVEEIEFLPEGTELEFGKEWDGHEASDVLDRLLSLRPAIAEPVTKKKPGPKPKAADDGENKG